MDYSQVNIDHRSQEESVNNLLSVNEVVESSDDEEKDDHLHGPFEIIPSNESLQQPLLEKVAKEELDLSVIPPKSQTITKMKHSLPFLLLWFISSFLRILDLG